jgi:hypothetical protein
MPELTGAFAAALLGAVASALAAVVGAWTSTREKRRREALETQRQIEISKQTREELRQLLAESTGSTNEVERYLIDLGSPPVTGAPRLSREEIRREVENSAKVFQDRLDRIEQRFPEEATLEKIASINDAILATRVEQLQKSLEQLESRLLSKWDVATIVFAVIGAVGALAGAIFAVANFVLK